MYSLNYPGPQVHARLSRGQGTRWSPQCQGVKHVPPLRRKTACTQTCAMGWSWPDKQGRRKCPEAAGRTGWGPAKRPPAHSSNPPCEGSQDNTGLTSCRPGSYTSRAMPRSPLHRELPKAKLLIRAGEHRPRRNFRAQMVSCAGARTQTLTPTARAPGLHAVCGAGRPASRGTAFITT